MLAIPDPNRFPAPDDPLPKLAVRAYLAGLGTAATLIVGATVIASIGLELVFG